MKKVILLLTIPYLFITIIIGIILFSFGVTKNIENNVVKIIKKAEIVSNFENELETENKNLKETIFTGFFVDKNTILTAAHGVNNKNSIYEIIDKFGNVYNGVLVEKNLENDTAILRIDEDFKYFEKFKYAKKIGVNDDVRSVGFGEKGQIIKNGIIKKIDGEKIFSNILFEEGDSGGPLLNKKNEVIGVNIEMDLSRGFGVSMLLKKD